MYDGKVVFEIDLNTKHYDAQMQKTKNDLNILMEKYDELNKLPKTNATKEWLTELGNEIQKTANKYVDLKTKQDAVMKADYKKSIASVKNINMMDNTAYNKSYALQYQSLGNSILKIKGDLPYVANGFKDIGAKAIDAGNNSIEAGKQAENSGHLFDKGFSRGLKSVKKLALGIVGIRSAYMLARRAASAYMSEDTELTEKMNKAWFNLGTFLEPFLSFVADAMLKLTGYLNEFIKALTGTDYLARANAKALAKQTKEQENLNSAMDKYQQYDFDVIRTQSSTGGGTGGTGGVSGSGLGTLGDVELNEGLVKGIQNIAGALKKIIDLITFKDVREAVEEATEAAHIATGTAKDTNETIGNAVDTLTENPTQNEGLLRFQRQAYDDVKNFLRLIDNAEEKKDRVTLYGALDENFFGVGKAEQNQIDQYSQSIQKIIYGLVDLGKAGELSEEGYTSLLKLVTEQNDAVRDASKINGKYKFTMKEVYQVLGKYAGVWPQTTANIMKFSQAFVDLTGDQQNAVADLIGEVWKGEKPITDYGAALLGIPRNISTKIETPGIVNAAKGVAEYVANSLGKVPTEKTTKIKVDDTDAQDKATSVGAVLGGLAKKPTIIPLKATLDDSDVTWRLQNVRSKLENIPFVGATFSKLFSGIFGFASGGYVSQPTLAWVGEGKSKGEYMIPDGEDYISRLASEIGQYGGGGTTNIYLDGRLIQRQVSKTANKVSFTRNGR